MPCCAGQIAVCDAKQRQLHFIEHPEPREHHMFRVAGRRRLGRGSGSCTSSSIQTSQVVGDLVVAMPSCAGKIAGLDMTITVQVARFTQSLRLQPSNEKEVSDRTITWLKQNSSSLSEVVHRKVEAEFLDDVLPPGSNALILSRARDHLQNLVKTPGQGGGAGGGAGGGGSVPFSGPPKTFATSAFKRAY
eukprot:TRINITY_DN7892_c0_g1_i2.p3 TRINITY_DN7892_c0_g1~~TRINITY_DN7892_c0_g1_i2.p3  ORF type:complete len:218 (+),score=49.12 TRINITY_DN7892_c0_g1_i2:85-654(+)